VYLYGVKGATRNRKKVYVHRLVATHFVGGRKSGNVVHHKVGPANNTKSQLEWVTPSENAKARKYFNDDGTRRKAKPKAPKAIPEKKVKVNVPPPKLKAKTQPVKAEKAKIPPPEPPKPDPPQKPKNKPAEPDLPAQRHNGKRLPDDPDEYYNADTFKRKVKWLYKAWPPFKKMWKRMRKELPQINEKNFPEEFKKATGKSIAGKLGNSPASWNTKLISAIYELERRIQRDDP